MAKRLLLPFLVLAWLPCAQSASGPTVTFDTAVEVSQPTLGGLKESVTYSANKEVVLDLDRILWVQAKGRVPVLVVPTNSVKGAETPRIRMPEVASWPPALVDAEIERRVVSAIEDIQAFQTALMRKDVKEAESILSRMESTHPMDYLNFLRASLNFVKGDVTGAKFHVERALQRYPANVQGQRLLKALEEKNK